jgi:hypothetical protein
MAPTVETNANPKTCKLSSSAYLTCISIGGCCRWDNCFQGEKCNEAATVPTPSPTKLAPTPPTPVPSKPPTQSPTAPTPLTTAPPTAHPVKAPTPYPTATPTKPTDSPTPAPTHPTRAPTPKATMKEHQVGWAGLLHIKKKMERESPDQARHFESLGQEHIDNRGATCGLPAAWLADCRHNNKCCVGESCVPCPS